MSSNRAGAAASDWCGWAFTGGGRSWRGGSKAGLARLAAARVHVASRRRFPGVKPGGLRFSRGTSDPANIEIVPCRAFIVRDARRGGLGAQLAAPETRRFIGMRLSAIAFLCSMLWLITLPFGLTSARLATDARWDGPL